jgi:phosphoglycerol transferase MdoB-like AlkP superfamily enzyme
MLHARPETAAQPFQQGFRFRAAAFGLYVCLIVGGYTLSNTGQAQFNENAEAGEIASNGIYNLFYAFWHNEINYEQFYAQNAPADVQARARVLLTEKGMPFEDNHSLVRLVKAEGAEYKKNVILVVMESMSASFMQSFGNTKNLTPNLDRLAREGLFFTNLYATGTRTVRGLEAVTLSVPPTPGQSIVRRPHNENLFSLGFVFKDRGYETKFIYGGHGYFDNMNAFFAGNGFDTVDRTDMPDSEVHFANVWGVADDDLFARVVKEADKSYAAGKPFMSLVMTTSNHRPYTYPEGKIDILPKQGREGGVKYADYSVGKLMEWAKDKPWYKDTVFVFVADHTHGAGGKAELDPEKYHIPLIYYAPGFIKQGTYDKIASQIDVAPILLGQLGFSYRSKFYGEDLMHDYDEIPHAFISNYQKVALIKDGEITVLAPKRAVTQYSWPHMEADASPEEVGVGDTIAYYQSASWWRDIYRREPTLVRQ